MFVDYFVAVALAIPFGINLSISLNNALTDTIFRIINLIGVEKAAGFIVDYDFTVTICLVIFSLFSFVYFSAWLFSNIKNQIINFFKHFDTTEKVYLIITNIIFSISYFFGS